MKFVISAVALFSTLLFADIVVKPDGTVTCTGGCTGTITGSTITMCQGNTCVTISTISGSYNGPFGKAHM